MIPIEHQEIGSPCKIGLIPFHIRVLPIAPPPMTEVALVCLPLLKSTFIKNFSSLFHVPCTSRLELFLSKRLKKETVAIYHFVIRPSRNQLCREAPLFGPFSGPLVWVGGDLEDSVLEEWVACHYLVCPWGKESSAHSQPKLPKMLISEQQLSEREQQLLEKSNELLALQKEMDSMRADFSLLRNQFLTERKKAEKQVLSLKEALKVQRSQLEKNLLVSTCCPGSLWRNDAFKCFN